MRYGDLEVFISTIPPTSLGTTCYRDQNAGFRKELSSSKNHPMGIEQHNVTV
jgi:hypothetical protein